MFTCLQHPGPVPNKPYGFCGRCPVNMPDPIRIRSGSAGKHWPEVGQMTLAQWLASGRDPFGQNLTQSARTKLDPGSFCTILFGMSVEERNRVWKWETGSGPLASCQKQETGPNDSCTPACFQTRCVWPNPGQATQIGSGSVLQNMNHAFFEKTELKRMREVRSGIYYPARFWLHAGRNGHIWP